MLINIVQIFAGTAKAKLFKNTKGRWGHRKHFHQERGKFCLCCLMCLSFVLCLTPWNLTFICMVPVLGLILSHVNHRTKNRMFHVILINFIIITLLVSKYSQTLMSLTHKGPMKTVQAKRVFELSGLNYVQIWAKGQEKGLETSRVFEPLQFERSKFHCTYTYTCHHTFTIML